MKKLNPIEVTILPIAAELEQFCKTLPPDISQRSSLHFEKLFKTLDTEAVRLWLDKFNAEDTASRFGVMLDTFLTKLRQWENDLRRAGVFSTKELLDLPDSDRWAFTNLYDDILDYAEKTIVLLKNIERVFQQRLDSIGLKDAQLTILCDLSDTPNIYRTLDEIFGATEDTTNISRDATNRYLGDLQDKGFVEKPGQRGGWKISEKGLSYLRIIGLFD